jgi:hypothetical protein
MREVVTLIRNGITATVVGLVFVITVLTSLHGDPTVQDISMVHPTEAAHVPAHCWTDKAPADVKMPGHVWATIPGGKTGVFGSYWTGKALDQTFGKDSTFGLTVMGFCR